MAYSSELPSQKYNNTKEKKHNWFDRAKNIIVNTVIPIALTAGVGAAGFASAQYLHEVHHEGDYTPKQQLVTEAEAGKQAEQSFKKMIGPEASRRFDQGNEATRKTFEIYKQPFIESLVRVTPTQSLAEEAGMKGLKKAGMPQAFDQYEQSTEASYVNDYVKPFESINKVQDLKKAEVLYQKVLKSENEQVGIYGGIGGAAITAGTLLYNFFNRKGRKLDDTDPSVRESLENSFEKSNSLQEKQKLKSHLETRDNVPKRESRKVAAFREELLSRND